MKKLHQIIAVLKGAKTRTDKEITSCYKRLQNVKPFSGISRTYTPRHEDGDELPPENNMVQLQVTQVLDEVQKPFSDIVNLVSSQDIGNQSATSNIEIDGQVIVENVPATTLIYLEKKVVEAGNIINAIPTLPVDKEWHPVGDGTYKSDNVKTTKTKKMFRNHVKAEATREHPAQVEMFTEDMIIGYWDTVNLSGAIPAATKQQMAERQTKLHDAIKVARTNANDVATQKSKIGNILSDYLFKQNT